MEQPKLWTTEELSSLPFRLNLKSPSASRTFCRESQQKCSCRQPSSQDSIQSTASKDAAQLRMQSWASKIAGRSTSGKSEMVPVGVKGDRLGQYHHRAVWTDAEIEDVFSLADQGMSATEIARKMDMPRSTVWAVLHGYLRGKTPTAWRRKNV